MIDNKLPYVDKPLELPESTTAEILYKIKIICKDNLDCAIQDDIAIPSFKAIWGLADALGSLREYDYSVVKEYFNAGKEFDSIEDYENYLTEEHERSK
jgi:hypothetical protein